MSNEELAPEEKRPTAADIKAQIEEKQRELKENPPTVEIPAVQEPAPQDQAPSAPANEPDKPMEPAQRADEVSAPPQGDKAKDAEAYANKKGWKNYEALIESYRNLEKKLGEQGKLPPQPPVPMPNTYPGNGYQPAPNYGYPNHRPNTAEIAQRYNLPPDDLERLAPLIGDLSEVIAERKFRSLQDKFDQSERERQREREIENLKQDPHFRNKEVASEMNSIIDNNPRVLEVPNGLTLAFHQALANVGRKRLEGSEPAKAQEPSGPILPTTPPTTARGTGPSNVGKPGISAPNRISPANFSGLPLDEKRRALESIGALKKD